MTTFTIEPRGPFSLEAAAEFLGSFTPGDGTAVRDEEGLALAFRLDGSFAPVGVALRQEESVVIGEVFGTAAIDVARAQVARILGLDVDGSAWPALGQRDPVVGRLQARYPGFRAVAFPSPYEAATWGVLAQRVPMAHASKLRRAMAERHGDRVEVHGHTITVFPAPDQLLTVHGVSGLPEEKLTRLHGIANAAIDGLLEAEPLRALSFEQAMKRLQELRGVGAWTAEHILMRGCALVDALPSAEPRVLRGAAQAYGYADIPSPDAFRALANGWRPYRMWVAILLVRALRGTPAWDGPERRGVGRSSIRKNSSAR